MGLSGADTVPHLRSEEIPAGDFVAMAVHHVPEGVGIHRINLVDGFGIAVLSPGLHVLSTSFSHVSQCSRLPRSVYTRTSS